MKKNYLIIICFMMFLMVGCSTEKRNTDVKYNEAIELVENNDAIIVDVRASYEYSEKHIKDSINISVDNIEEITDKIKDKDAYLILYCRSGTRSKKALALLEELGYTNVYNLGSIDNWEGEFEIDESEV